MIALREVSKTYRTLWTRREVRAVEQVSLDVAPGEVVGIAGPNGAGKSTLISILLGFLRPTAGVATIGGLPPQEWVEARGVTYVPELMALPRTWRVGEALRRLAVLDGVTDEAMQGDVDRVIARTEIGDHRRKRLKELSKGNSQRLGLAQALVTPREVVVFDEPTHGLDPVWTARFRDVVADLRAPTRAILIASHNLDELERVCDRVAIIDRGRLQRVVEVRGAGALADAAARVYRLRVAAGGAAVASAFPGARESEPGVFDLPALDLPAVNAGVAAAIAGGALVTSLAPRESALEAEFHAAVGLASAPTSGASGGRP
ncbi:MAG: ABC transporter ATP-binding protein [Gemmatimonadetes bacterium]|nr:ABC transporter ATP-binding protein [Gemmatimonadota bacterium]